MAKRKRKTLPKDFAALLEAGDLETLKAVFDACELDARGGYAKQTALAFGDCPDDLARWLVAQGADLAAADTWGATPLHTRAFSHLAGIDVLLELGADVHARDSRGNTPLHAAAETMHVAHASQLLARGAAVDARNDEGLTPLDWALRGCANPQLEGMAKLAKLLLDAGARPSPATAGFVRQIGERFEFHRAGFAKDSVDAASAGLDALYRLFQVSPVARRQLHDGVSPITVTATTWQARHAELWDLLVPSSGPAATVQGEVIRISGRLAHEVEDNGAVNWGPDYKAMARAFLAHVGTGTPLPEPELADVRAIVGDLLSSRRYGDLPRMAELAVAWVVANPNPAPLPRPAYGI